MYSVGTCRRWDCAIKEERRVLDMGFGLVLETNKSSSVMHIICTKHLPSSAAHKVALMIMQVAEANNSFMAEAEEDDGRESFV